MDTSPHGYIFYKFNPQGQLILKRHFFRKNIPFTENEKDLIIDIIQINPGYIEDEIYITCQYVKEKVEKATGRRQRPQFDNLSMEDGDLIFRLK